MVRITAIKVNLTYIKLAFAIILTALILFVIKAAVISNILGSSAVSNISPGVFKKAIEDTIILNGSSESEESASPIVNLANRVINFLMGFDMKNPQTVFACEMPYIWEYQKAVGAINISESALDTDELDKYEQPNGSTAEKAEIVTQESVTKEKGITLTNETKYSVDINGLINSPLKLTQNKSVPQVLIYHTHTCESYTSSNKYKFVPTDNDRTNDANYNVVKVGEQLAQNLKNQYGINVVHDKTVHDADEYNRAYSKSEKTLQGYIKKYPEISLIIDLHRDAANIKGKKLRTATLINGVPSAQFMVVIGTDGRGLSHPNWRENFKLGIKLVNKSNQLYPGFARGVNLKLGRFNQFYSSGAILIEVGANGNTLDEAINSTTYLSKVIAEVLKESK